PPRAITTIALHDALPISPGGEAAGAAIRMIPGPSRAPNGLARADPAELDLLFQALPPHLNRAVRRLDNQGLLLEVVLDLGREPRSEEHTSELQSQSNLVC